MKSLFLLSLTLILSLIMLSSCGGGGATGLINPVDNGGGGTNNQPTPTLSPTATPSPSPASTPVPPGSGPTPVTGTSPTIEGCAIFPSDNIWNVPVDHLPLDARSADYVQTIGTNKYVHADFGSGTWNGGPIGCPYVVVPGTQEKVPVSFTYAAESDPGPYPIPPDAPIEGGSDATGDRHVLIIYKDNLLLYELYYAWPQADGRWTAGSGALFDLTSNSLRPETWTSADAAGLSILAGLVRYEEVAEGEIRHAIRFTAPETQRAYVWPARHYASSITDPAYPPMGQRFRLKADFDITPFSTHTQIILKAMKKYGMILADNGSSWYIGGVPDERWDNTVLHELHQVHGSDFEAVDVTSLIIDPDSGQAKVE